MCILWTFLIRFLHRAWMHFLLLTLYTGLGGIRVLVVNKIAGVDLKKVDWG